MCLLRPLQSPGPLLRLALPALPRFGHDFVGLIAELGGNLPMRRHHLGGREDLLAVAGVVRGNLRGLRTAESAPCDSLDDLLAARAGGVKVLLRVAFDLRCAALARLDFVAESCEAGRSDGTGRRR